jgi:epsin
MSALLNRLNISKQSNWRHVYKTLKVLETLIQQGYQKVFIECCQKMEVFKSLDNFSYVDDCNTDRGVLVRNKVLELTTLLKELKEMAYKPPVRCTRSVHELE